MSATGNLSKEMMDLVKSIGEARSKQEEDKIIATEAQKLKAKFKEQSLTEKKMKDLLIRSIYVEMLGHDASFAHIHGINMTQKKNILSKRIGYLASTLFLDEDNELLILLVATLQRDLESDHYLEVLAALQAISRLANSQIMTATYELVKNLLNHQSDFVRKKAVMVMHKFWKINSSGVQDIDKIMKTAL
jgi:AP-4 complex subunit epsilon-1